MRGEVRKVHQQRLVRAHARVLGLAQRQRVQEKGVALVRHLHVQHAVTTTGGGARGLRARARRGGGGGARAERGEA